jgi:hypothetical protein
MKRIFLIYFLLATSMAGLQAQACLHDLTITGTYSTTYTKSDTWIKTNAATTIPTGGNVTLDANPLAGANGYVELNPGLETMPGSEFLAIVQAVCVNNPLPVSLLYFDATQQGASVDLNWGTTSEANSAGFELQRSIDGQEFSKIGYVKSLANTNFSNEKLHYVFSDAQLPVGYEGPLYYRLKQIDFDAKFEYSQIKSIEIAQNEVVRIYPNPVQNKLNVESIGNAKVKSITLFNLKGVTILDHSTGNNSIDFGSLPAGTYFVKIEKTDGKKVIKKVIKN